MTDRMNDRTTTNFAVEWSEDICDWIMEKADEEQVEPEVAVYGALAAAVVLARSVGMKDAELRASFDSMVLEEFPESMLTENG